MSRGDRKKDIYLDDVDRQDFLKTLAEACQKTGFEVHAYCLMRNHFHLVVETPNANLVAGMRWLLSSYTIRLNHRQKLFGHVFSGRYKAISLQWHVSDLDCHCGDAHVASGFSKTHGFHPRQRQRRSLCRREGDRKSTRLNSSHLKLSRMPSSA